jgi:hypothetical protein
VLIQCLLLGVKRTSLRVSLMSAFELCALNQQATATCLCGVALTGQPVLCQKGQWCHGWEMRGMRVCTP